MADENLHIIPTNIHADLFNLAVAPGQLHLALGQIITGVVQSGDSTGHARHLPNWTHVVTLNVVSAKALATALGKALAEYEKQFGAIPEMDMTEAGGRSR